MGDSEKPFACPSPGCNMSFTNEDHLVVHKKKHDMVLNLGSNGKNTFVADQTPTPTRFIRNCEEVGLFQDLQNVNPFEETFRRAVEAGKTGTLSEPEVSGTDDTLHTPHIFPNISDVQTTTVATSVIKKRKDQDAVLNNEKNLVTSDDDTVDRNPTLVSRQTSKNVEIIIESKKHMETESNGIVVQEADTSITTKIVGTTTPNLSINGQEVQLLLKTADGKMMQLSAVPFNENRNNYRSKGKSQNIVLRNEETMIQLTEDIDEAKKTEQNTGSNRMTIAKMRLKQALTKNGTIAINTSTNGVSEPPEKSKATKSNERIANNTEQRRKQEVQARNRASSMRSRAKRKAWIQQLQRTAGNANEKNAALQLEVKALRSEVARLRALLLAHEDCPVTKSIQKGSLITAESKTPPTILPMVQNIRLHPTNVVTPRKRSTTLGELPIAPKISKASPSLAFSLSSKPQVILPITEVKDHSPVVNDASSLKILDVRSLLNVKEPSKRIVLMPNSGSETLEIIRAPSRSIIQVHTSTLHIENDASKCTGT